jgi:hypothetical protein
MRNPIFYFAILVFCISSCTAEPVVSLSGIPEIPSFLAEKLKLQSIKKQQRAPGNVEHLFIEKAVFAEEEQFFKTLDRGLHLLDQEIAQLGSQKTLPGKVAFTL